MPAYYRVHIDGGYAGNPEVWSTSFAVTSNSGPPTQAALADWCESILTVLAGSTTGSVVFRGLISSNGQIRRVRAYWYPDVGAPAGLQASSTGAMVSGAGTVEQVPQVAVVLSLLTGLPGGRYRGRMYIPAVGAAANSSGKISSASQGNVTNLAALFDAFAAAAPETGVEQLAVVSGAAGAVTPVTSIRMGDVADTQRRRRDSLVEIYYTASVS